MTFEFIVSWAKGMLTAAAMMVQPCDLPDLENEYELLIDIAVQKNWEPRYHAYRCVAVAQIFAESSGNPNATSSSGAQGLAQFMPATWDELSQKHGLDCSPYDAKCAIEGYSYYSMQLIRYFKAPRPDGDRVGGWMTTAYTAGYGNADKAQRACGGADLYADMAPCLDGVIGANNAADSRHYVQRIASLYTQMTGRELLELP